MKPRWVSSADAAGADSRFMDSSHDHRRSSTRGRKLRGTQPGLVTTRESHVVTLMALGYSNQQIANIMEISIATVDTHRTNLRRRMGFSSLVDVVHYALARGLVKNKYSNESSPPRAPEEEPVQVLDKASLALSFGCLESSGD